MRIGIDGRPLIGRGTGIRNYIFNLCQQLNNIMPEADFFIYSPVPMEIPVVSRHWKLRVDPFLFAPKMKPILWLKMRCALLCKKDKLDVFWGTASFLPNLPSYIKTVVTVYDLTFKIVPETMTYTHLWAYRLFFKKDISCADKVLAISKGTSNRLYRFYGRAADKVITPGIDGAFYPRAQAEIEGCLNRHGINQPYILSVATWEPRKNIESLVRAFIELKKKGILSVYKLVLVGARGWKNRSLCTLIKDNSSFDIVSLGYAPSEDLPHLYSGASVFVFPSLHEGFGIPVLEARACGTRIVTTDAPELREAGGEDAIYVQPTVEGIREGLLMALSHNNKKKMVKQNLPTWIDAATILAGLLQKD